MKRTLSVVSALAVLAALAIVATTSKHSVPPVYAQSGCTDATLTGNYGFDFNGFTSAGREPQSPATRPLAVVGVATFNGAGSFSTAYTISFAGNVTQGVQDIGTYIVNADCTGSSTDTTAGLHFNFVILGGGAEVFLIQTDAGNATTGVSRKQ